MFEERRLLIPGASVEKQSFQGKLPNKERERIERYALLSVYDKTGIVELARGLDQLGYRIISTGGTAKKLTEGGIPVIPIQEITGNPECFDGRMKTISFPIESGILYKRENPSHQKEARELGIKPIDIVVCNLYPFEKTVADPNVSLETAIENIDIGGPTMVRAAAKNFEGVLVVTDPKDYARVVEAIRDGKVTRDFREELALKAFSHTAFYDSQIAHYLAGREIQREGKEVFPEVITLPGRRVGMLRYGENPHQRGAWYLEPNTNSPLGQLQRLAGRELSLINLTDINAGLESVRLFVEPAAVVIKHNTPCGIALGETIEEALSRAIEADPESAFGGVIVLNKPMDLEAAEIISSFKDEKRGNIDIVAAPEISTEVTRELIRVRKTMGVYAFGEIPQKQEGYNLKWLDGGFVLQTLETGIEASFKDWRVVTDVQPTAQQRLQMEIGWKFVSRVRSNSVIVVDPKIPMTRGIGCGQTSRYRATKIALEQAREYTKGGILVSDSFFPFSDSVESAAKAGIAAIVQQGGSINDKDSIRAANEAKIPMVFTGRRAFWH